jgi:ketosteroid isomerase-like protein
MSQENVEVVRSLFSGFEQRGLQGALDALSFEIEWDVRADLPDSRRYEGHDGMRELFAAFEDVLDEQWYRPQAFIATGDLVVVPLRWGGRGKTSGAPVEEGQETWVLTIRHGTITNVREFATKKAALEAAGLVEQDAHVDP